MRGQWWACQDLNLGRAAPSREV